MMQDLNNKNFYGASQDKAMKPVTDNKADIDTAIKEVTKPQDNGNSKKPDNNRQ